MNPDNEIPSGYVRVTSVLKVFQDFSNVLPQVLERAADRGQRVHQLCEAHSLGLFIPEVDDDCKHYFSAFTEWFDSRVEKVLVQESRMNSAKYRLSGQVDMIVLMKNDTKPTIVDIKTPLTVLKMWKLQTAAYRLLAREELGIECNRRLCLMLPNEPRSVKISEYVKHDNDERLFLNALELHRECHKNKL